MLPLKSVAQDKKNECLPFASQLPPPQIRRTLQVLQVTDRRQWLCWLSAATAASVHRPTPYPHQCHAVVVCSWQTHLDRPASFTCHHYYASCEVQTCIWPSGCHCHSLSLAPVKSRLVFPFWYRFTRVVPDKGLLNGCVCVYYARHIDFIRACNNNIMRACEQTHIQSGTILCMSIIH